MCATRMPVAVVVIVVALSRLAEADTPRDEDTAMLLSLAGTAQSSR